jgi:hypothetical protein
MSIYNHVDAFKQQLVNDKMLDICGPLNDWEVLKKYSSQELYSVLSDEMIRDYVEDQITLFIDKLPKEEQQKLTQDAYEDDYDENTWMDLLEEGEEPADIDLVFPEAVKQYMSRLVWKEVDQETMKDVENEEHDIEDYDEKELLDIISGEIEACLESENTEVRELCEKIQPLLDQLRNLMN